MSMYIGVSMLILYNILIGVINQCMVEITQNAAQEFRFAYTMRVAEYVSANQTYPCVPPLNFLQIFVFWPLRKTTTLSRRSFALIRSLVLLVAYAPHLVIYALYKNVGRWWRSTSGMHRKALRAECHLAEKELTAINRLKHDAHALAGSVADEQGPLQVNEQDATVGSSSGCLASSPAIVAKASEQNDAGFSSGSRWTTLVDAWRIRRNRPCSGSPLLQSPVFQSPTQLRDCDCHALAEKRVKALEAQMANIDKKLATIARLLQPVTDEE
ncbi:hypothetical protein IWW57_001123 [Coemansia sp. S610]|nr:hypothetical protein IWW57_001123 [Coemansia sp. S610]